MRSSSGTYRPRGRGRGGGGIGQDPPPSPPPNSSPHNLNSPSSSSTHSHRWNPNLQNPTFSPTQFVLRERPGYRTPSINIERVESAVSKVQQDLLAAGENVASWKVTQRAALSLHVDSWSSLGYKIQDVPSLRTLQFIEGKVNTFIHCFVSVRRMTSVHDLGVEICKSEGVEQFEELGLGPLLRHPLVQHYFSVPPDATEVCDITIENMVNRLSVFLYRVKNREFAVEEFLDFLVQKYSVPARENLGVRIQGMGLYVKFVKGARRTESATLRSIKENGLQVKVPPGPSDSVPDHLKFSSSLGEGQVDNLDMTDTMDDGDCDITLSSQCCCSSQNKRGKKRLVCNCRSPPIIDQVKLLELKLAASNSEDGGKLSHGNEEKFESLSVQAQELLRISLPMSRKLTLTREDIKKFVEAWKWACEKYSAAEVLAMMLHIHVKGDKQKRKMQKMFLSYPGIGLLNIAVRCIKYGMLDSLAQSTDKHEYLIPSSTPTEWVDIEPSNERDAALDGDECIDKFENSVTVDSIIKQVATYFGLHHLVPSRSDLPLKKPYVFGDCEAWLKTHFSVKTFELLGHGNFFEFLNEHISLLPEELHYFLTKDFCINSSLEVSMVRQQLLALLSQASRNLGNDSVLNRQYISMLLKKQFPAVSFQVVGSEPEKTLPNLIKSQDNCDIFCSVLFSGTLLGNYCRGHSLLQSEKYSTKSSEMIAEAGNLTGFHRPVSPKDAIECLLKVPMLSDLQLWSHWDLIFAPSLGPLLEWLLNEGYIRELSCVVTREGRIIRIDHSATLDEFLEASIQGSSFQAAVKLLSLFCAYGGSHNVPLSLLKCYAQRAIDVMIRNNMDYMEANKSRKIMVNKSSFPGQSLLDTGNRCTVLVDSCSTPAGKKLFEDFCIVDKAYAAASTFILDCLGQLPSEFRSFAADILVSGLQCLTKDAALIILSECKQTDERIMLHEIGFSLGILEWIEDYQAFSSTIADDLVASSHIIRKTSEPSSIELGTGLKEPNASENLFSTDDTMIDNIEANSKILDVHKKAFYEVNEMAVHTEEVTQKIDCGFYSVKSGNNNIQDANFLIETIRREEFGLDPDIKCAESNLLKKQHARLGRALHCLSQELYSQDSHFLLELVQNADDNTYSKEVEPTLVFILQDTGILVLNNEQGFSALDIRALCDVGNSTKMGSNAGYIGKKGIGFKSVFRVTDAPEIHSNGFHVKFDVSKDQIGFILPTIIPPYDMTLLRRQLLCDFDPTDATPWNTCIVLPFKLKLKQGMGMSSIMSMFTDLHPSLLLFLHRLQCIKLKNMIDDKLVTMRRETLADGIVTISYGKEKINWLVVSKILQACNIRPDVQATKIDLAFTLQESDNGDYKPHLDHQPVFAFLPLRKYGLRFILNGDFVLPSSREEVDQDSAWNQWLLSEFPDLFVSAEKTFCALPCFLSSPGKAVTAYMSFVPLVGEVHGFFSHLPHMVISKLRVSNCLLLDGPDVEWVPPCRVLRGWDELARNFLSESLLQQHIGLGYLSKDIILPDPLANALGIQEYGAKILIEVLSSICQDNNGIKLLGLDWLSSWLNAFYAALSAHSSRYLISTNLGTESDLINNLRNIPFIPLSDGSYASVVEGPIWLPCDGSSFLKHFPGICAKLRTVTPFLFSAATATACITEETVVERLKNILQKMGVQQFSAHDVIRSHILPSISDEKSVKNNVNLLPEYLSFIMTHLQTACSNCHMEKADIIYELRRKPIILTTHGYKCPLEEPIHFGKEFGNSVDVKKLIDKTDIKWNEVDGIYLKHRSSRSLSFELTKWREFFLELGVNDFVQVIQVNRNAADVLFNDARSILSYGDLSTSKLAVTDWESPELVQFLSTVSTSKNLAKSKYLLKVLDKMWDEYYGAKAKGYILFQSGEDRNFESSFMKIIRNSKWVASSMDEVHYPMDLFYDCESVRAILGSVAPYAVPKLNSKRLLEDIGFKVQVTLDDAFRVIQYWRKPETLCTSISQMSKFYTFIRDEMAASNGKFTEIRSTIYIFIPFVYTSTEDVILGIFMSPNEVYWHDPTGCVDRMKENIHQCVSASEIRSNPCMTLSSIYPSLHKFFVSDCGVLEAPPSGKYIQILLRLSNTASSSQVAHEFFQVLLKWANDLKSGSMNSEEFLDLKESLLKAENTVLPTMQDKWVSLHPQFGLICWSDDKELMEQFMHFKDVYFLQFGELSAIEKEMFSDKVAGLLRNIGVPALSEVVSCEAIYYGIADTIEKASLINWILPYAQRYLCNLHPDIYLYVKQFGSGTLSQLQVIVVDKLFYRHALKGQHSESKKRFECSCLLQGDIFYTTHTADSHSIFLELSRHFFHGTRELHMADFLHTITIMAELGSTKNQIESFVVNSRHVPELPDGEPIWSLSSLQTVVEDEIVEAVCGSPKAIMQSDSKLKRKPMNRLNWPPTSWKTAYCAVDYDVKGGPGPAPMISFQNVPDELHESIIHAEDDSKMAMPLISQSSEMMEEGVATSLEPSLEHNTASAAAASGPGFGPTDASKSTERDRLCFEIPDEEQSYRTGRLGETVAYKYFIDKLGSAAVKWVNEESESGLPYDLIIEEGESREYVEVKATKSANKDWFPLSTREWRCAAEKGDSFSIAWVVLSSEAKPKISVLKNPLKLCQRNVLQLAVVMTCSSGISSIT